MARHELLSLLFDTGSVKVHVPGGLHRHLSGDSHALASFRDQILADVGKVGLGRHQFGCREVGGHRIAVEVQKSGGDCATVLCASA